MTVRLSPISNAGPGSVVIVGGGGFARETLDVIDAHNRVNPVDLVNVLGIVDDRLDDQARAALDDRRVRVVGTDHAWLATGDRSVRYLIGVGHPEVKRRIDEAYSAAGFRVHPGVVHPDAGIGSRTSLGPGAVICAGAQLSTNVRTGRHVHVNPNATVGHDAVLADFVSINPAAVISGHVHVAEGCLLGAGAVVLETLTVGPWSTVGAAACVTRNVPPHAVVKGVPAR